MLSLITCLLHSSSIKTAFNTIRQTTYKRRSQETQNRAKDENAQLTAQNNTLKAKYSTGHRGNPSGPLGKYLLYNDKYPQYYCVLQSVPTPQATWLQQQAPTKTHINITRHLWMSFTSNTTWKLPSSANYTKFTKLLQKQRANIPASSNPLVRTYVEISITILYKTPYIYHA